MSVFDGLGKLLFTQRLSETLITRALASKGLTDAQARAAISSASSIAAGLRAIGLTVVADMPAITAALGNTLTNSTLVGSAVTDFMTRAQSLDTRLAALGA